MNLRKIVLGIGLASGMVSTTQAQFPNGISSGDTTQNSTVLWARTTRAGAVHFTVKDAANQVVVERTVAVTDPKAPAKLAVTNLLAGQSYSYQVADFNAKLIGSFKTPAAAGVTVLSFGVTGDWRGELAPYPAVKNVNGKSLNFFVKLGDTIYADYPSPAVPVAQAKTLAEYRLKHNEVYSRHLGRNSFARFQDNVSIFSTIDDHEVINDFSGGALASTDPRFGETTGLINETGLYKNGLQAFIEYNAIADKRYGNDGDVLTDGRPDLYRAQRYGSTAAFYMLDARSFRDEELPGVIDIFNPIQIGGFIANSFDIGKSTTRTMLGKKQLERLKADLLAAQQDNILWKFVAVPEPIQNLGVFGASDRFEGYASERSELLQFIDDNSIKNVVFIAADIHGTIINDLTYQRRSDVLQAILATGNPLAAPQIKTSAFEISTGSVAFDAPFGDSIIELLGQIPNGDKLLAQLFAAVGVADVAQFNQLPMAIKNAAFQELINTQLNALGYTPIGLQDNSRITARVTKGSNVALFSYGWSRVDILKNQELKITTYGISPYTAKDMADHGDEILSRTPVILSQIVVKPQ